MDQRVNDQSFDRDLSMFVGELNGSTSGVNAEAVRQRYEMLAQTASALHESLAALRLSVKYLVFDLEATRRENAELKRRVFDMLRDDDDAH